MNVTELTLQSQEEKEVLTFLRVILVHVNAIR